MEKKCQKFNIIQMLKSTLFSNIFLSKCTFPAASHPVYYSTKKYSCHFYSFIISVYISNVFAIVSLITRFARHLLRSYM